MAHWWLLVVAFLGGGFWAFLVFALMAAAKEADYEQELMAKSCEIRRLREELARLQRR